MPLFYYKTVYDVLTLPVYYLTTLYSLLPPYVMKLISPLKLHIRGEVLGFFDLRLSAQSHFLRSLARVRIIIKIYITQNETKQMKYSIPQNNFVKDDGAIGKV